MRCPTCNKFAAFDTDTDPEVSDLEIDADGRITASVRIVNTCAECSEELKEYTFDVETENEDVRDHLMTCHADGDLPQVELSIDEGDVARTDRGEGKGRYRKTFYGFSLAYAVTCNCGQTTNADGAIVAGTFKAEGDVSDDVQASHMDELV